NPRSEEEIYGSLKDFKDIVLQGSPMSAIGNPYQVQSLSNCVVVPGPEDSIQSIMDTGKALAQLFKRRCVEENTLVFTLEKGPIPIKNVSVGMQVLSYDLDLKKVVFKKVLDKFNTDVPKEDRVVVSFSSGAKLHTS